MRGRREIDMKCAKCGLSAEGKWPCRLCSNQYCDKCQTRDMVTFSKGTITYKDKYPGQEIPLMKHAIEVHGWKD